MTIDEIQDQIDEANQASLDDAADAFQEKVGRDLTEECVRLLGEIKLRTDTIRRAEAPIEFGEFDQDAIARILAAETTISYDGYDLDPEAKAEDCKDWTDAAFETTWVTQSDATVDRNRFIREYEKYLYAAATFAKSLGSIGAVRLYLSAWRILQGTATRFSRLRLSPEDALSVIKSERAATRALWLDAQAAKLPKFRPVRARKRLDSKGSKRKG